MEESLGRKSPESLFILPRLDLEDPEMASGDRTGPVLVRLGFGWRRIFHAGLKPFV